MKHLSGNLWRYQVFSAIAIVILEVPTGMIADRLGKRISLIYGCITMSLGWGIYALGHSFLFFLIAELVLALGIALQSGANSALLYDTLKGLGREGEYKTWEGRARAIQMTSFALCNLMGGFVGHYAYRSALWLSALGPFLSIWITLGFMEAQPKTATQSFASELKSYHRLIFDAMKFVYKHRLVRWYIILFGVFTGSAGWLLWLYQPYMEFTGLPVWAFGLAFTLFNLFAALLSQRAHAFDEMSGRFRTIIWLMLFQITPFFLMSRFIHPLSFLFILGHQAVRGLALPILSDRILQYTYADKRATVLSIASLASRLFFAVTSPFIGLVAQKTSMPKNLLAQGIFLTVLLGLLLLLYRNIPPKYFQIKASVVEKQ